MTFNHANFNFILTYNCNYNCEYCLQGSDHTKTTFLSLKMFSIIIDKIFKMDFKSIDITLMGGELSTDEKYLEYFEYIYKLNAKYQKQVHIVFLTNFSTLSFYKKLLSMTKLYNIELEIEFTLHSNYVKNSSYVIKKMDEYLTFAKNINNVENTFIFLENFLKFSKEDTYYNNFKNPLKELNNKYHFGTKFEQLRQFKDCPTYLTTSAPRRCNALYYKITPDGKIRDECRNIKYNFINLKFIKKEIICTKPCPCPFLENEFTQVLIND